MSPKVLNITPRIPGKPKPSEAELRRIEAEIAAKGEGVAGQPLPVSSRAHKATTLQAQKLITSQAQGKGTRDNPRIRRDGQAMRSTTVHLPIALAKRLAVYCAEHQIRQSEAMAEAIGAYLDAKA